VVVEGLESIALALQDQRRAGGRSRDVVNVELGMAMVLQGRGEKKYAT
jgi:hypothetical protein